MFGHVETAEIEIKQTASELQQCPHLPIGRRISIAGDNSSLTFGRATDRHFQVGINIPSMRISKFHAELLFDNGRYCLIRHSKNLIALNGREIERGPKYALENADIIVFAGVIKLQVHLSAGDTWPVITSGIWLQSQPTPVVKVNGLPLDPPLDATDFRFLEILYKNAGSLVTREQLFAHIWPHDYPSEDQLDRAAYRVRCRLREVEADRLIRTRRGLGYQLDQPPHEWDMLN